MGLKCTSHGCERGGSARCIITPSKSEYAETRGGGGPDENGRRYRCDACGNSDFCVALDEQAASMEGMKRLERAINDGSGIDDRVEIETRRMYERLKGFC